jgi:hypothetical protein
MQLQHRRSQAAWQPHKKKQPRLANAALHHIKALLSHNLAAPHKSRGLGPPVLSHAV